MINSWRNAWDQEAFPFYFVQLANYRKTQDEPPPSDWAELREAQSMTLKLPNTRQAVIIDICEADDIHPRNKQDVGRRLARIVLAKTYARDITHSGPTYRSTTVTGGKIRLAFDNTGSGMGGQPWDVHRRLVGISRNRDHRRQLCQSAHSGPGRLRNAYPVQ